MDVADGPIENRQRGQAQKVELDQPDVLDVVLVELRHRRVGAGLRIERTEVGELARRDQYAARVHADVAREALELFGKRQELAHFLLRCFTLGELWLDFARVDHVAGAFARIARAAL